MTRRRKRLLVTLAALVVVPSLAHLVIERATRIEPRAVDTPAVSARDEGTLRRAGESWTRVRGGARQVYLSGTPEQIGASHAALLYDRMVEDERVMWSGLDQVVPIPPARWLLLDVARVRYRGVARGFPDARARELAAQATTFAPDPYEGRMPTYQRMSYLHALYDIALGFEGSPLVGCTSFAVGAPYTKDGHVIVGRAFDFEAADVFDTDKAVFVVREEGRVPFLSVSWPGLVGVVTGMNVEGVSIVVHGARAKEPVGEGTAIVFSLREALSRARTTDEAVELLSRDRIMVSHMVFVTDAAGRFAVVERAPGAEPHVRRGSERVALSNHLEGPLASDPKNQRVREQTTTLPRRARMDELLAALSPGEVDAARGVSMLRDHTCAKGEACAPGDRRAIDAFIATHGFVADLTERVAWVSVGPHLSGRFVRVDLRATLTHASDGGVPGEDAFVDPDPALTDGRYAAGRARAGPPLFGGDTQREGVAR